ncbi:hypothetical protein BpHYR1_018975 [Brachionus plicatilis]|uniref:Uncharacterized protein n=1 Tax=Brachionus plicatilis TaxID=10195 RepID=A0A3M7PWS4_BRAPC|nr:hypothetical protein BpHYR1_018975 [Brachionus plicatilis]
MDNKPQLIKPSTNDCSFEKKKKRDVKTWVLTFDYGIKKINKIKYKDKENCNAENTSYNQNFNQSWMKYL